MQYTQDYDEILPFAYRNIASPAVTGGRFTWMDAVQPYIKSYQLFKCPSDSRDNIEPQLNSNASSYGVNMGGWGEPGGSLKGYPMNIGNGSVGRIARIESVTTTVFAVDANNMEHSTQWNDVKAPNTGGYTFLSINTNVTPRTTTGGDVERHLETLNVLWCDGHVKAMKLDNLLRATSGAFGDSTPRATYFTIGADPD